VIRDWVGELAKLSDEDWCRYAFNRDPLVGRIQPEDRLEYGRRAIACGIEQARKVRAEHGDTGVVDLAGRMRVKLQLKPEEGASSMFAYYQEPDTIAVYTVNAKATNALVAEYALQDLVGDADVVDVLVAHELYHVLEHTVPGGLYTSQKHVALWKFGLFEKRSRILCLEEIGAMAFARELVGLKCSAYVYNVLMLTPASPAKAQKLYERIMRFKAMADLPHGGD
jgi:hypothetical protein